MSELVLYHVEYGWKEFCKEFIPRIPKTRTVEEDGTIERICFSDSIEGCLNGKADRLFECSENDCTKIMVYKMRIQDDDPYLKKWREIYEEGLVPDAALTHEYWYLKRITLQGEAKVVECVEDARRNKRIDYIIKPEDREKAIEVIQKQEIDINDCLNEDICTIVNVKLRELLCGWYGEYLYNFIIEQLKEEIRIPVENSDSEFENCIYENIFGEPQYKRMETMTGVEELGMYRNLKISNCDGKM